MTSQKRPVSKKMTSGLRKHTGSKYVRAIPILNAGDLPDHLRGFQPLVDVYSVIEAFDVRCPARQHALKKLLCAGIRGKGDETQDLLETIDAVIRASELAGWRATGGKTRKWRAK